MAQDESTGSPLEYQAKMKLAQAEARLRAAKTAAERVDAQKMIQQASAELDKVAQAAKKVTVAEAEKMLREAKTAAERVNAQNLLRSASEEAQKMETAASAVSTAVAGAATTVAQELKAEAAPVKKHVVKKGESLSLIAKQYTGDVKKWKELYEKNKEVVGNNPDLIQPGMELIIPWEGV